MIFSDRDDSPLPTSHSTRLSKSEELYNLATHVSNHPLLNPNTTNLKQIVYVD